MSTPTPASFNLPSVDPALPAAPAGLPPVSGLAPAGGQGAAISVPPTTPSGSRAEDLGIEVEVAPAAGGSQAALPKVAPGEVSSGAGTRLTGSAEQGIGANVSLTGTPIAATDAAGVVVPPVTASDAQASSAAALPPVLPS